MFGDRRRMSIYADVDGNIGYTVAARVPIRKKGHGTVPVPGDIG